MQAAQRALALSRGADARARGRSQYAPRLFAPHDRGLPRGVGRSSGATWRCSRGELVRERFGLPIFLTYPR